MAKSAVQKAREKTIAEDMAKTGGKLPPPTYSYREEQNKKDEAERIAEQTKPNGVTQADLDRARRQGIDIFRGRNIKRLSEIDINAAAGKEQSEEAVLNALEKEQQFQPKDELEELMNTPEGRKQLEKEGALKSVGATAATLALGAGVSFAPLTGGASIPISAGIVAGATVLFNLGKSIVMGEMKEDFFGGDEEEYISGMIKASQEIIDAVKTGAMEPEDAITLLAQMRANSSNTRATMTQKIINNPFLRDAGGLAMLQQLSRIEEDLVTKREIVLRLVATGAIQPTAFTKEELIGGMT